MERVKLNAQKREETGKNKTKKLRKADVVPACLYKRGKETKNLKVDKRSLFHALHTKAGENVILDLLVKDDTKQARPVMIKEIQYHPIKDEVLHVDFSEISLTEKIKVNIPIATKGTAEAVTKEDGALEHIMWEVEVECLPTDIPEKIEVDVSALKIGDKVHIKDLNIPPERRARKRRKARAKEKRPPPRKPRRRKRRRRKRRRKNSESDNRPGKPGLQVQVYPPQHRFYGGGQAGAALGDKVQGEALLFLVRQRQYRRREGDPGKALDLYEPLRQSYSGPGGQERNRRRRPAGYSGR
jgi:large subunit ribosomal protein L25